MESQETAPVNATGPEASAGVSAVNRSTLTIVFLTVFIDLLGFGIVLPLLPRYAVWFSASGLELSLLMASFSAMQFHSIACLERHLLEKHCHPVHIPACYVVCCVKPACYFHNPAKALLQFPSKRLHVVL